MTQVPMLLTISERWSASLANVGLIKVGDFSRDELAAAGVSLPAGTGDTSRGGVPPDAAEPGDGKSNPLGFLAGANAKPVLMARWRQATVPAGDPEHGDYTFPCYLQLSGVVLSDGSWAMMIADGSEETAWHVWLATLPAAAELLADRVFAPSRRPGEDDHVGARDGGAAVSWTMAWSKPGLLRSSRVREGQVLREADAERAYLMMTAVSGEVPADPVDNLNLDEGALGERLLRVLTRPFEELTRRV